MHEIAKRPSLLLTLVGFGASQVALTADAECTLSETSFSFQRLGGRVYSEGKLEVSVVAPPGKQLASIAVVVDNQPVLSVPATELEPRPGGWFGLVRKYHVGETIADAVPLRVDDSGMIRIEATDTAGGCVRTENHTWQTGSTDTFAVIVGINDYPTANAKLAYARQDAEEMARHVRKNFNVSAPNRLFLLTDQWQPTAGQPTDDLAQFRNAATRVNILNALSEVHRSIDTHGKLIFYYAGHGFTSTDTSFGSVYYLLAQDSDRHGDAMMIAFQDVASRLTRSGASRAILIFDACFSDPFVAGYPTVPFYVEGRALSGTVRNPSIDSVASRNVYIMTAGTGDELAYEVKTLGHGAFTHLLLKAHESLAPDGTKLTMYQAFDYARESMDALMEKHLPGKKQTPNHHISGSGDKLIWWQRAPAR